MMEKEAEELSVSDCNTLDKLLANRDFSGVKRQLSMCKSEGKDVKKYEKRSESLERTPVKELTGEKLWKYLGDGHGYNNNQE